MISKVTVNVVLPWVIVVIELTVVGTVTLDVCMIVMVEVPITVGTVVVLVVVVVVVVVTVVSAAVLLAMIKTNNAKHMIKTRQPDRHPFDPWTRLPLLGASPRKENEIPDLLNAPKTGLPSSIRFVNQRGDCA